jgi:quercetin dioxygenase-like cupin family protein
MKALVSHASDDSFVPGRRDFLRWRDLGLEGASNGRFRATVISAVRGMEEPTGWHYHECEGQLVYIMRGWSEMQLEDGSQHRLEEGSFLFLPGGTLHNESAMSDDLLALEVSIPGDMGTVPTDPPASFRDA